MQEAPQSSEEREPSFANVPLSAEGARRLLQRRLRLYAALLTSVSALFYAVNSVAVLLALPEHLLAHAAHPANVLHVAQIAFTGALWIIVPSRPWSERTLWSLDAVVTVGAVAILGGILLVSSEPVAYLVISLCFVSTIPSRAIFVPSTALRTLAISGAAALLLTVLSASAESVLHTVNVASWAGVGVIIATVASWIIFGLTERVREAHQLGQYTLHDKLGGGGMGEVYRAHHAMLRRPTAVKLVRPTAVDEDTLKRFEREVRLTARLAHPNTVAVYDYGRTPDGIFYYAMELLDGVDLQRLVDEHGPMPEERVVHVLEQVCASLAEAHELGLIHRDVKPANIVLCARARAHDVVKVLDFGLVKDLRAGEDLVISGPNKIAGTPLYLAPEAITAPEAIDARGDLYAIGLVGWFLLTGRPVFLGKNIVEVCAHHLHTAPERPSSAGVTVGQDLEDVIMRCLEKRPDARYPDADSLRRALRATRAAGKWTDADARAWWTSRAARARDGASSGPPTGVLSIDLSARTPEEPAAAPERPSVPARPRGSEREA